MKTLKEIESRCEEIQKELAKDDITAEEIDALTEEVNQLEEERSVIKAAAEKRQMVLSKVLNMNKSVEKGEERKEGEENMEQKSIYETAEYRSAFLKQLQGSKLTEAEERAMTSAENSAGVIIPTETSNKIIEKLFQQAPLLNEIELLRVEGNVTFAVEVDPTDANIHVEGASITEDGQVLIPVTLSSYEINKYITISKTVRKMSIDAFETWLINMISKRLARKIVKLIISGTGNDQPKGVKNANDWDNTNSVEVPAASNLKEDDVTAVVGLLPGAYDANAKWLMSKKTLFTDFRPLQNKSKNDVFAKEGSKYFVEGYEVMLDDSVETHEAYFGDFKMYVGNLSEDVTVETGRKLQNNTYEYLGSAMFDGKPAVGEAFVKLSKASN